MTLARKGRQQHFPWVYMCLVACNLHYDVLLLPYHLLTQLLFTACIAMFGDCVLCVVHRLLMPSQVAAGPPAANPGRY